MIEFLTDPQNILSMGVGVLVFATIMTLMGSMAGGAKLEGRMKAVAIRRDELKRRSRQAIASGPSGIRHTDEGFKKRIVDQLNLAKRLEDPKVVDKMAQAGFRGPKPITTFYFFRLTLPFAFMFLAAIYLFPMNVVDLPVMQKMVVLMVATLIGYYAPNIYLKNRISKRQTSIVQAFPDCLDLLLI